MDDKTRQERLAELIRWYICQYGFTADQAIREIRLDLLEQRRLCQFHKLCGPGCTEVCTKPEREEFHDHCDDHPHAHCSMYHTKRK